MRGTVAKRLRTMTYGEGMATSGRKYYKNPANHDQIVCDKDRQVYKKLKKRYTKGEIKLV